MNNQPARRNNLRVSFDRSVEVYCDGESLGPCRSADVSEGGIKLKMSRLPRASRLRLFFAIPGARLVHLEGEVVWRKLRSSGIRFIKPSAEALLSLRQFIDTAAC